MATLPELRDSKRYPKWYDSTLFSRFALLLYLAPHRLRLRERAKMAIG
jgi:hypothetical protein